MTMKQVTLPPEKYEWLNDVLAPRTEEVNLDIFAYMRDFNLDELPPDAGLPLEGVLLPEPAHGS